MGSGRPIRKRQFPFGLVMLIFGMGLGFWGGIAATKRALNSPVWVQRIFGVSTPVPPPPPTPAPVVAATPPPPVVAPSPPVAPPTPPSAPGDDTQNPPTGTPPFASDPDQKGQEPGAAHQSKSR